MDEIRLRLPDPAGDGGAWAVGADHGLFNLELCYAPPYGSAKDPINMAGFVAANALRGDVRLADVADVAAPPALGPGGGLVVLGTEGQLWWIGRGPALQRSA